MLPARLARYAQLIDHLVELLGDCELETGAEMKGPTDTTAAATPDREPRPVQTPVTIRLLDELATRQRGT